jgi:hypothetical protein
MNPETAAYSTEAHSLALRCGASATEVEKLCSREALLSILTDANIEQDICEDVCDTCELGNLNAITIASGVLSTEQIAQFCFLTKDEAEACTHSVPSSFSEQAPGLFPTGAYLPICCDRKYVPESMSTQSSC